MIALLAIAIRHAANISMIVLAAPKNNASRFIRANTIQPSLLTLDRRLAAD
jgi:hypothetical protein